MNISDLKDQKLPELREMARGLGLSGYSGLRKQELIYSILEAHAERSSARSRATEDNGAEAPAESPDQKNGRGARGRGRGDSRQKDSRDKTDDSTEAMEPARSDDSEARQRDDKDGGRRNDDRRRGRRDDRGQKRDEDDRGGPKQR